jgi:YHS domain-containing protein
MIRLAIIAALIYIIFRLLTRSGSSKQRHMESPPPDDLLVEDPVCHTYVPQKDSESLRVNGTTYYFCSKECLQKFKTNQGA